MRAQNRRPLFLIPLCSAALFRRRGSDRAIEPGLPEDPEDEMPHDSNRLTKALGEAVVRLWSDLPAAAQHGLFEAAVACEGETIRTDLALFLHYKHQRTADSPGKAQEVPEPDSLGG